MKGNFINLILLRLYFSRFYLIFDFIVKYRGLSMKLPLITQLQLFLLLPNPYLFRVEHEVHVSHGTADKQYSRKGNEKRKASPTLGIFPDD